MKFPFHQKFLKLPEHRYLRFFEISFSNVSTFGDISLKYLCQKLIVNIYHIL